MEKKVNIYTTVWFIMLLVIFSLPLIQELTGFIDIEQVRGKEVAPEEAKLSFESWFSGDFQQQEEHYVQRKFNFRNFLIRLHCQFNYSCLGLTNNSNIIVGKDNYLFKGDIIQSYFGEDLRGEDTIRMELEKLKFVQDTLEKLNKHLVFVIAPSKPSFCFDKIPESSLREKRTTNYELFVKHMNSLHINYIDYGTYFKTLKLQTPYLLFSPKGIHWSVYSTSHVIDSLIHYIEYHKKTKIATYKWSDITIEDAKDNDLDVENVLNLFFPLASPQLAYRKLIIEKKHNDSLKIISIADSFYGELFYNGLNDVLPTNNEFWFYGRIVKAHDYNIAHDLHLYQVDLKKKIKETDVFIILYNDANLKSIGFKMIDRLYRAFTNQSLILPIDEDYAVHIHRRMEDYRMDPNKMKEIEQKAALNKISLDSMLEVESIIAVETDVWNKRILIKK